MRHVNKWKALTSRCIIQRGVGSPRRVIQRRDWSRRCIMQRRVKSLRCIMQRGDFYKNHWLDSPLHYAAARFDSPLHNVAARYDSPLHYAVGSQTSIQISLRIWNQVWKKFRIWIRAQGGSFWWKKTEVENLALLSL